MWLWIGTSHKGLVRFVQRSGEWLDSLENFGLVKDFVLRGVS
jgi:hypothetical protein